MTAWEMVLKGRHEEADVCYRTALQRDPDDWALLSSHATNALCLERFDEALLAFQKANAIASQEMHGETQPYVKDIGVVLWLVGRRDEAIRTLTSGIDGILCGDIKFSDTAGGASIGLLLWYAGVTWGDQTAKEYSLKFLGKLAKKPRMNEWPGGLGLFVLRQKSREELLSEICGTKNLRAAVSKAAGDLLRRRSLVKTIFYLAAKKRDEGLEEECRTAMVECATLENPILELEWYLARAEANDPQCSRCSSNS